MAEVVVCVVLAVLLLLALLLEKWCASRSLHARENRPLYEYWRHWEIRMADAQKFPVVLLFLAVVVFALTTIVFVGLTTWFPPTWE